MLLRAAIAEGVEYVDLEADIADQIPLYGRTKRIISLHNFRETPENLEGIHARLANSMPTSSRSPRWPTNPTIMCGCWSGAQQQDSDSRDLHGRDRIPSRILAGKFGAPFTYATFHHERTWRPDN